jgi:hypothetical protein
VALEFAHLVHAVVGGSVDLNYVEALPRRYGQAVFARATRLIGPEFFGGRRRRRRRRRNPFFP